MKKTIVYIDGFNLYYSLKNMPYKWLNISKLVESVLDPRWHKIIKIKYFTARSPFSESAHRQEFYLKAIRTLQNVEIIFGKFKKRDLKASVISIRISNIFGYGRRHGHIDWPAHILIFDSLCS